MVENIIQIKGATILPGNFRNFEGRAGNFNQKGDRSFNIVLNNYAKARYGDRKTNVWEDLDIDHLIADGWNVRFLNPRDEGDLPTPILKLNLKYRDRKGELLKYPPKVFLVTTDENGIHRNELSEETVGTLDNAEIECADITITPYNWDVNKVSAYVRDLEVTLRNSRFDW